MTRLNSSSRYTLKRTVIRKISVHEHSLDNHSHQPQSGNTSKCLATDEWINSMRFVHTMGYYLAIKIRFYICMPSTYRDAY